MFDVTNKKTQIFRSFSLAVWKIRTSLSSFKLLKNISVSAALKVGIWDFFAI